MPIPDYRTVMLPFLKFLSDGVVRHVTDVREALAVEFGLTQSELAERLPSSKSTVFESRTGWSRTYLKKAGLIEPVARGQYQITDRGLAALKSRPAKIDNAFLKQFPEFVEFIHPKENNSASGLEVEDEPSESQTPLEILEGCIPAIAP